MPLPPPPASAAPDRESAQRAARSTPDGESAQRAAPTWIGWAATGVLAAGAVGTGIAALVQSQALRSEIDDHATPAATIRSAHATTATLALVSDVLTGSAVAAAGITLYVKVASKPRSSSFRVPSSASCSYSLGRAELRGGLGSLWLSATF